MIQDRRLPGSYPARRKSAAELVRAMRVTLRMDGCGARDRIDIEQTPPEVVLDEGDGAEIRVVPTGDGRWLVALFVGGRNTRTIRAYGHRVAEAVRVLRAGRVAA